jgi:hypothetical protein
MSEIEQNSIWNQIDLSDYLFLNKLFEPRDNSLTIILDEAKANHAKNGPTAFGSVVLPGDSSPIEPTPNCHVFTLHWKSYVSYCVTEEMHGSCGKYEDETYTGRLLRVYSQSHYLDFVAKDTGAHSEPYHHYKICCLNHVIDIVSTKPPEISNSAREEAVFIIN